MAQRRYVPSDAVMMIYPEIVNPDPTESYTDAALTGWCWALKREPDSAWTLRRIDWRTGELSSPVMTTRHPLPGFSPAIEWASEHVRVTDWTGDDEMLTDFAYPLFRQVLKTAQAA